VIRKLTYNLWDTEVTRNLGQFDDEREALHLVRILVRHHGVGYANDLSLGSVAEDGSFGEPLSGAALIARFEAVLGDCEYESEQKGEVIASHNRGPAGSGPIGSMATAGRGFMQRAEGLRRAMQMAGAGRQRRTR
jgi:hypothetical protein